MFCKKLKKEGLPMAFAPFPGKFGEKILLNISKEGWELWLSHQTILINEYRLNMLEKDARDFLKQEMEKFLFGEGSNTPEEFIAKDQ
jgi:Fe-S cluster biosynthesis and repair protein YggX